MDKIQIPKLKGQTNWSVWKLQIQSDLQYHEFEGILNGDITKSDSPAEGATAAIIEAHNASMRKYKRANGYAITLLTTTVDDERLRLIEMHDTAKLMWDKLVGSFERVSEQRLEHLYLELLEYGKDPGDSIASHIAKLQKIWQELQQESTRVDGKDLPITLLLMRVLSTLPEEYREFRTTWESVPRENRTIAYLQERLSMVEMRIERQAKGNNSGTEALFSNGKLKGNIHRKEKKSNESEVFKYKCNHCKKKGHMAKDYRIKLLDKSSKNTKGTTSNMAETYIAFNAVTSSEQKHVEWCLDSGSSSHMTANKELFQGMQHVSDTLNLANKETASIKGVGEVEIRVKQGNKITNATLSKVLYVPDLRSNLLSVSKITDNNLIIAMS